MVPREQPRPGRWFGTGPAAGSAVRDRSCGRVGGSGPVLRPGRRFGTGPAAATGGCDQSHHRCRYCPDDAGGRLRPSSPNPGTRTGLEAERDL
ncbi:hypothetical protein YT1_3377 [Rhodococcus ruber]|nr:hypothetical protein YT1_3377 [Rhodococcus ruber]